MNPLPFDVIALLPFALLGAALGAVFMGLLYRLTQRIAHGRLGPLRMLWWQIVRLAGLAAVGAWVARHGAGPLLAMGLGLLLSRGALFAVLRRRPDEASR